MNSFLKIRRNRRNPKKKAAWEERQTRVNLSILQINPYMMAMKQTKEKKTNWIIKLKEVFRVPMHNNSIEKRQTTQFISIKINNNIKVYIFHHSLEKNQWKLEDIKENNAEYKCHAPNKKQDKTQHAFKQRIKYKITSQSLKKTFTAHQFRRKKTDYCHSD